MSKVRRQARVLTLAIVSVLAAGFISVFAGSGLAQANSTLIHVYSPAMNKTIPVKVLLGPGGGPKPTLYLLDGLRAPDHDNGWLIETDVERFFADKRVNVAIPFGGGGSFYTDWQVPDPVLGVNKWETFLTKELPPALAQFGSDGVNNAIAGLSMSGTSALNLTINNPHFYKAVASFSGYPVVSMPGFAQGVQGSVVEMGGNPFNMWGFWPAGDWGRNDPLLNAHKLRGKAVYISSGSGAPWSEPSVDPLNPAFNPMRFIQLVPLETAASAANQMFVGALHAAGVNPQVHISAEGIHWWTYWEARLKEAWFGTLGPALGA